MRMYRGQSGAWFRTQSEGKASGEPFEPVDVPTDHAGLTAFLNRLAVPVPPPEPAAPEHPFTMVPGAGAKMMLQAAENMGLYDDPATRRPYQNGHPTTPFMGSRDPRAVFTCTNCGKDNSNA